MCFYFVEGSSEEQGKGNFSPIYQAADPLTSWRSWDQVFRLSLVANSSGIHLFWLWVFYSQVEYLGFGFSSCVCKLIPLLSLLRDWLESKVIWPCLGWSIWIVRLLVNFLYCREINLLVLAGSIYCSLIDSCLCAVVFCSVSGIIFSDTLLVLRRAHQFDGSYCYFLWREHLTNILLLQDKQLTHYIYWTEEIISYYILIVACLEKIFGEGIRLFLITWKIGQLFGHHRRFLVNTIQFGMPELVSHGIRDGASYIPCR